METSCHDAAVVGGGVVSRYYYSFFDEKNTQDQHVGPAADHLHPLTLGIHQRAAAAKEVATASSFFSA